MRLTLFLCCGLVFAQPQFEVASVRPSAPEVKRGSRGGPGSNEPGQITIAGTPLLSIVMRAYALEPYEVSAPDWLSSSRYDIAASVPVGTSNHDLNLMLQSLLAERFHLRAHRETREISGYELVVAKNGSKLREAVAGVSPEIVMREGVRGRSVVSRLNAKAQPVSAFVDVLVREFRLPVLDSTGLSGTFDFTLEFAPQAPGALPPADAAEDAAPNLLTAVQEQLGLKFNAKKVPVQVLVVDSADKTPTEN